MSANQLQANQRVYGVARSSGRRYYLHLYSANYDRDYYRGIYARLRVGLEPTRTEQIQCRHIAGRLLGIQPGSIDGWINLTQHKIIKASMLSHGAEKSGVLHLAPSTMSGFQVCAFATLGCMMACLENAGHGSIVNVKAGRIKRTKLFFQHREIFLIALWTAVDRAYRSAVRSGSKLSIRLNGTSDLPWEFHAGWLLEQFKNIQFYDYTKIPSRMVSDRVPNNYHLTFSRAENNGHLIPQILDHGSNVAVVFMPEAHKQVIDIGSFAGYPVCDGSGDDRRYLDPSGHIVALRALSDAKRDMTGFVIRTLPTTYSDQRSALIGQYSANAA